MERKTRRTFAVGVAAGLSLGVGAAAMVAFTQPEDRPERRMMMMGAYHVTQSADGRVAHLWRLDPREQSLEYLSSNVIDERRVPGADEPPQRRRDGDEAPPRRRDR